MRKILLFSIACLALNGCDRQGRTPQNPPVTETSPDNTARNARDTDPEAKTSFDQSEKESDRMITQQIRQALMADQALSTNAKNIKIITINGLVTLRGPVADPAEKDAIAQKVRHIRGILGLENELEITSRR